MRSFGEVASPSPMLTLLRTNGGGNPVAAFDVDVSNNAIGDLGSPLGSSKPLSRQFELTVGQL